MTKLFQGTMHYEKSLPIDMRGLRSRGLISDEAQNSGSIYPEKELEYFPAGTLRNTSEDLGNRIDF